MDLYGLRFTIDYGEGKKDEKYIAFFKEEVMDLIPDKRTFSNAEEFTDILSSMNGEEERILEHESTLCNAYPIWFGRMIQIEEIIHSPKKPINIEITASGKCPDTMHQKFTKDISSTLEKSKDKYFFKEKNPYLTLPPQDSNISSSD